MSAKLKSSSKKRKCSDVKHTPIGNYFQKITFHDNKQKISPVANISERLNHIEKTIVKENKSLFLSDDIIPPTPEQVINNNTPRKNYAQSKNSSKKYIENSSKIFSLTKTINSNKNLLELNSKDASESLTNVSSLLDCKSVPEKYKKNMLLSKAIKRTTNESQNCTKVKKKISKIEIQENHSMLIQDEDDDDDFLKGYGYDTHKLKKQLTSIKSFSKSSLNDKLIDFVDTNHMGSDFLHKHQTITNDSLLESEDFFLEVNDTDLVEDLTNHKLMLLKVKEVTPRFYISSDFGSKKEILLILESTKGTYSCHLREDWINMEVEVNDLAYVSGFSSKCFQCVLDNSSSHFITLYPNTLISGTCISTGIFCDRNAVLNEHFKNDEQNEAMLLGTITHDLFDWAVQNNLFSEKELEKQAQKMLCTPKYIELLYGIDKDEAQMLSNLQEYFSSIADWQNSFLNPSGKEIFFKTGQEFQSENNSALVHIQRIIDIEENIWAPCLGLKGKIDVSVELVVQRKPKVNKYTAPLELKTGKMFSATGSIEHRAQVALYTILMSEKYSQNIDAGLLLYLKTKHLQGIPVPLHERRALIIKRNSIARKLTLERDDLTMPGLLGDKHKCTRCFQNQTCMLYHMAIENGDANTSGVDKLFIKLTQHINRDQLEFFKRWYELIMMEIKYEEKTNKKKYFWLETSQACEARGDCLSGMKVAHESRTSDEKLHYIFRKCNHSFNVGMLQIHFIIGERVIVSEENKKVYNTVAGYIIDVSSETVTISVNRKIPSSKISSTFRIDKDGFQSIYKIPLSNLSKLYKKDSPKDEKIRRLIINKEPPRFSIEKSEEIRCSQLLALNGSESVQGAALNSIFSKLNAVQKAAIEKCLVAEDYLIMLGMPGAGKSTTIACLVRALVLMGKSVLLTSYTHSAVDTILVKLLDAGFESFLRIGESSRVNNKVIHLTSKEQTKHFSSTYQLKDFYSKQNVVATTCLGISHPIFLHKHFDYCIVDEASQVTLPVCIGPIRYANAFILVGDHNQLPPLVQSPDAREKGLDVSLFRLLTEAHPEAVLTLNHQYRMNNQIMLLTNSLIYNNAMKCGNDDVAGARIKLPLYESYKENCQDFLLHILNPERSVVFIDTDASEMFQEKKTSHGVVNQGEARLVKDILDGFLHSGLTAKDIGVISPYRQQLKIIRKELSTLTANVEVDTIDKYQGKDKKCIIVSLVRSNKLEEIGDLLTDWRRVNVAITRAKTKLILIGSASTVKQSDIFDRMLKILEREKWIFSSV